MISVGSCNSQRTNPISFCDKRPVGDEATVSPNSLLVYQLEVNPNVNRRKETLVSSGNEQRDKGDLLAPNGKAESPLKVSD